MTEIGSGFMGDANGGIGQGVAFVLPDGKAQEYAMQLAQTHSSQLQALAKTKAMMQQKAQLQYEKDFQSQELPKAFGPIDKEINDRQNKWLQDAAKSYGTTGKNPFNDPDFIARHNTEVLTPAAQSRDFGEIVTKRMASAQADKDGKYSDESKKGLSDWYDGFLKADNKLDYLGKPIPELKDREQTDDDLIKSLKPMASGDPSFNNAQVFAAATGDPKWKPLLQKYGYNPDLPDFAVYTDPSHPYGKRVWYTNPTFTSHQADLILNAADDPKNAQILQSLGIHPGDQYAKEKLQHAITDQNAAMGKFVQDNGQRLTDPQKVQQLQDEKTGLNIRKQELGLSYDRLSLEKQRLEMEKNKAKNDNMVQSIFEGNGSLEGLNAISKAYQVNGKFREGLKDLKDDGDNVSFTIPAPKKLNPNYVPQLKEGKNNPHFIETGPEVKVNISRTENPVAFKAAIYEALKNVASPRDISKIVGGSGIEDKKPAKSGATIKGTDKSIWDN